MLIAKLSVWFYCIYTLNLEVVREWLDSEDSDAYDEEVGQEALLKTSLENGSEDFETLDLVEDMDIAKQAGEGNAGYEQSQVRECTTKTKAKSGSVQQRPKPDATGLYYNTESPL